ncbi:xanthan lyase [Prevotella sp. P6B1]|uniref:golvesin C-terminal-like domain-containing protein n=1 Tax=Prevotella sp. P6B1 TaxID=1410613 RepID=UPI00051C99D1|nr:xanthan lyase [Prevotella sp. P6B1]
MSHSKFIILALTALLTATPVDAARKVKVKTPPDPYKTLKEKIDRYFVSFKPDEQRIRATFHLKTLVVNDTTRTIEVCANNNLGEQLFTSSMAEAIYQGVHKLLPDSCQDYQLTIKTNGWDLRQLVPNRLRDIKDKNRTWGHTDYHGRPWVRNVSLPYQITEGLQDRHLSIWASHGRYFNVKDSVWKWQRPPLFGTREDLFTPTIVTPYLIPMLQNAGAVVFTPRERDWQRNEYIVDNDTPETGYSETNGLQAWHNADSTGFAFHPGTYVDSENPFNAGTARMASTADSKHKSQIVWQPAITEAGNYAVYVSYHTVEKSIDDAHYTVWHQGVPTRFSVNQQMGQKTWVYLGTFYFDQGQSTRNCVTLSNVSRHHHGVVTADAVRFGGGMGNVDRGKGISGLPRCLEGARYYAQWAGMPYEVYSTKEGQDDYGDDINVRSYMTNHLAGGSVFVPDTTGLNVPIELSLAIHSDAGYAKDGKSHIGTLTVCTTTLNDSILKSGMTRLASRDLADELLYSIPADINKKYGNWVTRELYDRNYSESRCPMVPSAILETMSHQNFADMRLGQDPHFRFDLARSIYKALLRYVCTMHHKKYVVQPLTPNRLSATLTGKGTAKISWRPVYDEYEATAKPTGYVVYTAVGNNGFDNGTYVKGGSETSLVVPVEPEQVYSFRVSAVNEGGESFPSEVVSVFDVPEAQKTILVVNGFDRLASPTVVDNSFSQGFDLEEDAGVTYGRTAGWLGYQTGWEKSKIGSERRDGLGYTNDSLMGQFIAGNDFDYIRTHTLAIATARKYRVVSCSSQAIDNDDVIPEKFEMLDVILGLQRQDGYSTVPCRIMSPILREHIYMMTKKGGSLLVSGAYLGTDMQDPIDRKYLEDILKLKYGGRDLDSLQRDSINGLGIAFTFYRHLNEHHYAAHHPEILEPVYPAFSAMKYADDFSACVAYDGTDYKAVTMGFPLECIKDESKRNSIMRGLLQFLLKSQ